MTILRTNGSFQGLAFGAGGEDWARGAIGWASSLNVSQLILGALKA
ncbi:MAG: hypothetical protein LCH86_07055 [Proteobacteria bacterium]|nr:hypothetical protein [Pseudomonadota bacterium]